MKAKILSAFLLLLCVIYSINVYPTVNSLSPENTESRMRHVHLTGRLSGRIQKKATPTDSRVEAYIVDNLITINIQIAFHNEPLRITIKDSSKKIAFDQTYIVSGPGSIQFTFDNISEDAYLLEIFGNEGYLYGEF